MPTRSATSRRVSEASPFSRASVHAESTISTCSLTPFGHPITLRSN